MAEQSRGAQDGPKTEGAADEVKQSW